MQLDGRRGGGAQHILEWGIFGLTFGRKAGVLLLKNRQSQHITERERVREDKQTERQLGDDARVTRKEQNKSPEKITIVTAETFSMLSFIL